MFNGKRKLLVSNENVRCDLDDGDLKVLGESLKRLSSLESVNLNFVS